MRRVLSSVFLTAGVVLAVLGTARLLFGIVMDLPFLPPVSLGRVSVAASIVGALACFAAAGVLGWARGAVRAQGGDSPP